ncbi:MAG: hypothetical protein LBI54_09780 [Lachnospiraceae bacterium]|nr:hypothetical protein [Lachnospiraceae bacterium]
MGKTNNQSHGGENTVRIHANFGEQTKLYQLGTFALNLNELLVFLDILERDELGKLYRRSKKSDEQNIGAHIKIPHYDRYYFRSDKYKDYRGKINIVSIKDGSIVLELSDICELARIILPIVFRFISQMIKSKKKGVSLEISENNKENGEIAKDIDKDCEELDMLHSVSEEQVTSSKDYYIPRLISKIEKAGQKAGRCIKRLITDPKYIYALAMAIKYFIKVLYELFTDEKSE